MEAGEAELHLRLDPDRPYDSAIVCRTDGALEERGFTDPGLAAENKRPTESAADGVEQVVERRLLADAINETRSVWSYDRPKRCAR
jgi:hypothetical protein